MYEVILTVLALSICLIHILIRKDKFHPVVLFEGLWGFVFFLCSIKYIEYYEMSEYVFILFFTMIICFPIGDFFLGGRDNS